MFCPLFSVTVSNGNGYNGTRTLYSPDHDTPPNPLPPAHHPRPHTLVKTSGKSSSSSSTGKRTRWLLCYHMGGGGPGDDSPSPPSEKAGGGESQCSTPSPTDHGFRLPNSFSNERPTSLPVALLGAGAGPTALLPPMGESSQGMARFFSCFFVLFATLFTF